MKRRRFLKIILASGAALSIPVAVKLVVPARRKGDVPERYLTVKNSVILQSFSADFTSEDLTGAEITGPGIPSGTKIVAVHNSHTITISQPAFATVRTL